MQDIFHLLDLSNKPLHECFKSIAAKRYVHKKPNELVSDFWKEYQNIKNPDFDSARKNMNGQFLELLIQYILCVNNILPFYKQARVAFVPNVTFDILLYTREIGAIVLSIKTSLRERYKQADLEAIALKQVHRRSRTFLLTVSEEYIGINKKIEAGEVTGLEKAINCLSTDLNNLITELKKYTFIESGVIQIVSGRKVKSSI
jgi:hypothetical protein